MDQPVEYDDGTKGENTYGHHPLYLTREKSNKFHIVFFRNSNAMDIVIDEVDDQKTLTYKTVGGVLDFKFFLGTTPDHALDQYHSYFGGWE